MLTDSLAVVLACALVRLVFRELAVHALERSLERYLAQHDSDQQTMTEWRRRWERYELDPRTLHDEEPPR